MFDLLKKSRAVKFLCSACLLCSLGSFVNVNAEDNDSVDNVPVEVATAYVQGKLGFQSERIVLDNAALDLLDGSLSSGKLRWRVDDGSDIDLDDLTNPDEDAYLTLFLVDASDNQLAVTDSLDLSDNYDSSDPSSPYNLAGTQFYQSTSAEGWLPKDGSAPYESKKPGKLRVFGIISKSGKTSLISGPTQETTTP